MDKTISDFEKSRLLFLLKCDLNQKSIGIK